MGREIDILENSLKDRGYHSITWDASSQASGIYYIHILSNGYAQTQKVMLLK